MNRGQTNWGQMIRLAAATLMLGGGSAQAMISPCAIEALVADAVSVVQLVGPTVEGPGDGTICALSGPIARVFSGPHRTGEVVSVGIPCVATGMPGPTRTTSPAALAQASVIELHLTAGDAITAYGWGIVLLDAVTDRPAWMPLCKIP